MTVATNQSSAMPRYCLWRSFSAAFASASLIRPPPMAFSMNKFDYANHVGTLFSIFDCSASFAHPPSSRYDSFLNRSIKKQAQSQHSETTTLLDKEFTPRIAVIGGGIAGVTAASALAKRLEKEHTPFQLVLFEQDTEGGQREVNFGNFQQPVWTAATARNANSMVPGAAMHVMSQRSTLGQILVDTCQEVVTECFEKIRTYANISYTSNVDNFEVKPPYFALHLFRCIGPSASWEERMTFVEFMRHFLVFSLFSGEKEARQRGTLIQDLARSNRVLFLEALKQQDGANGGPDLSKKIGTNKGFLSLHRSRKSAEHAEQEGKEYNEATEMIPISKAIELEPRIANLPMANNLFAVHRKNDYTANSAVFVKDLVKQIKGRGIQYRCGNEGKVQMISSYGVQKSTTNSDTQVIATSVVGSRFKVKTSTGSSEDFDFVVLAAGVNTPLLAKTIQTENAIKSLLNRSFCPTYPLRGYSLTVYTNHTEQGGDSRKDNIGRGRNLLNTPISIDDMYCSSVGLNMARMAGFGELVGYRKKAKDVPSLAPKIMTRYIKQLFPESDAMEEHALQCFRPMTPDDIPLVGEVQSVPGLYLHTGHGTLGWTLCLATAECVAQSICDDLTGNQNSMYQLPGNIEIEKAKLSPSRFQ